MCQILQERRNTDNNTHAFDLKQKIIDALISISGEKLWKNYRSIIRKAGLYTKVERKYFENAVWIAHR